MRIIFIIFCILLIGCGNKQENDNAQMPSSDKQIVSEDGIKNTNSFPNYARKVIDAYPDFKIKYTENLLCFSDGTTIVCDDGKKELYRNT